MKIVKLSLILLLITTFGFTFSFGQGLEVSPVRFDFSLEPSASQSQTLTVRNTTNKRASYTLSAADWILDEAGGVVRQEPGKNKYSCADWISFNPSLVELEANESKEVTISINVPKGGKKAAWAMAYVSLKKEQEPAVADKDLAMGIEVNQSIGVFVTQSPRSNTNAAAKLIDLKEAEGTDDNSRAFTVRTENLGEKILDCNMYLVISDLQNATEEKLEPIQFKVLPEGSRVSTIPVGKELKKGSYQIAAILDYGPQYPLEGVQMQLEID